MNIPILLTSLGFAVCMNLSLPTMGSCDLMQLSAPGDGVYTGHLQKEEDTARLATDIVVAKFISVGFGGGDASGETYYEQAKIEVVSSLKGSVDGQLVANFTVSWTPDNDKEAVPIVGVKYLMFVRTIVGVGGCNIIKILPASDANIGRVKALIVSQSKH